MLPSPPSPPAFHNQAHFIMWTGCGLGQPLCPTQPFFCVVCSNYLGSPPSPPFSTCSHHCCLGKQYSVVRSPSPSPRPLTSPTTLPLPSALTTLARRLSLTTISIFPLCSLCSCYFLCSVSLPRQCLASFPLDVPDHHCTYCSLAQCFIYFFPCLFCPAL